MQACGKKEQNTFRLRSLSVETLSRTEICKLEKKLQGGIIFLSFLLMLRTFLFQISWSLEVEDPLKSIFQHNCMSNLAIECVLFLRDIDTFEKGCVLTNSPCWWCKLIASLYCDKTKQLAHLNVQWSQGGHPINSGQ